MHEFSLLAGTAPLPLPYDAERAEEGVRAFAQRAAALGPRTKVFADSLAADARGLALLGAVFGNSPFLTSTLLAEVGFAESVLAAGPDAALATVIADISGRDGAASSRDELMRALRVARRRAALAIGLADIAGLWPVPRVTQALSRFADTVVGAAVGFLSMKPRRAATSPPLMVAKAVTSA